MNSHEDTNRLDYIEEVGLTASARLIYQLGEQLISDEFVALSELIKNAYDADCRGVRILVDTNADTPYGKGKIVIEDNGNGMTRSILLKSFLRVSTSFKKTEKLSPFFKRRTLGEKGLGRLSIQRLGNFVTVNCSPRIDRLKGFVPREDVEFYQIYNDYTIILDWKGFEDSERDISDVKAKCIFAFKSEPRPGTRIIIEGIRNLEFWNIDSRKESRIRTELFGMVNPFTQNLDQSFQIMLEVDGEKYSNEKIDENVLDVISDIKVSFSFINWNLQVRVETRKKYLDRLLEDTVKRMQRSGFEECSLGKQYETIISKYDLDLSKEEYKKEHPYLKSVKLQKCFDLFNGFDVLANPGNFHGNIYVCEQSPEALNEAISSLGEAGVFLKNLKEIRSIWSAAVGVYLFRNDFRILPYGPEKDWLKFTARSQRGKSNSYKAHTVSGYVQLDGESSENLKEQTSRLGLIEDEFGVNFLTIVGDVIADIAFREDVDHRGKFEIKTQNEDIEVTSMDKNIIFKRALPVEEVKEKIIDDLHKDFSNLGTRQIDFAENVTSRINQNLQNLVQINQEESIHRRQEKYLQAQKNEKLSAFIGLAGQGMIVESLTHELHRIETNISDYARETKRSLVSLKNGFDLAKLDFLISNQDHIMQEIYYLQQQLEHLEPMYRRNRFVISEINLKEYLENMYLKESPLSRKAQKQKVSVKITGDDLIVHTNKGIVVTVFDNLFLNSMYWVQEAETKEIIFEVNKHARMITMWDSGLGIHRNIESKLFEAEESMKPDGRGLGLFIVKELMRTINGEVNLDSHRNVHGNLFKFKVIFPESKS
ncbi:ATP-binding protein [Paenibacillus chondroitinus]|uniref:histidine kinase n=1 Tax=Paenibacillus chondroitinus TaxID=59842 RepID=A0ABU6D5G1_9BACL|nr:MULTISPECIES: ATP-binding protein [Paenibacillus]MCY9661293.1 ATP-binding protein [Paenibacillus anseongense]MEB4792547.1 ATP-binding protein [Paenibacillus chondroitinus]